MSSTKRRRTRGSKASSATIRRHRTNGGLHHHLPKSPGPSAWGVPGSPESLHRMGVVCLHMGKLDQAVELLKQAVALAPHNIAYQHELGACLFVLGLFVEAEQVNGESLRLDPYYPPAVDLQAQLLHRRGKTEEAVEVYQSLRRQGITSAELHNNCGLLFHEAGFIGQAIDEYESALALNPQQIDVLFNLSELARAGRYDFSSSTIVSMIKLAAAEELDPVAFTRLCFAIGVALERQHDYDQAYTWFRRGNDNVRARHDIMYGASLHEQHVQFHALLDQWARRLVTTPAPVAVSQHSTPLFIVGLPRSGTTLLAQLLAGSDQIGNAGELDGLQSRLEQLTAQLAQQKAVWPLADLIQPLANVAVEYLAELQQAVDNHPRYIIDKTPENLLLLGFLSKFVPRARFIWLQRDWRDTCWSCYSHYFNSERLSSTTSDLPQLKQYHDETAARANIWWGHIPENQRRIVSYERLVQDPETTLRDLYKFLDLAYRPECLEFHGRRDRLHTASTVQVREPIHTRAVAGWRRYARQLESIFAVDTATAVDSHSEAGNAIPHAL